MIESLPPAADAYPAARNAVAFYEQQEINGFWETMREAKPRIENVIKALAIISPELADEIGTADFARFVAGKLGLM